MVGNGLRVAQTGNPRENFHAGRGHKPIVLLDFLCPLAWGHPASECELDVGRPAALVRYRSKVGHSGSALPFPGRRLSSPSDGSNKILMWWAPL